MISQLAGTPVRLQFMRWDEQGWDNYGPALLSDMRGSVDSGGNMTALDDTAFGIPRCRSPTDMTMQNIGIPYADAGARRAAMRSTPAPSTRSRTAA